VEDTMPRTRLLRGPIDGHKLSKASVNYSEAGGTTDRCCSTCRFFSEASCRLVEGTIYPAGISDLYDRIIRATPGSQNLYHELASADFGTVVPIIEMAEPIVFKDGNPEDAPEWIPYLPKPGTFKHPKYGSVVIDAARNLNFVKQFQAKVYQDRLPIDAEHQTAVSGALGWITDLRQNPDGSVDAKTSWTDRGKVMLANDRLPYFSPAFFEKWVDPTDGKIHKDVAIGGALTTRPFFKPKAGLRAVRPLVTASDGLYIGAQEFSTPEGPTRFSELQFAVLERDEREEPVNVVATPPPASGAAPVTLTADQVVVSKSDVDELARLREARNTPAAAEAVTASDQRFGEMQSTIDTQATALRLASEQIAELNRQGRVRHFSDIVAGRSGGKPWVGSASTHVNMLEMLYSSDAAGEDGQLFKEYLELQNATAEQASKPQAFSDVGSSSARKVVTGSAQEKIDLAVKAYQEAHKDVPVNDVMMAVFNEQPELYDEYIEEHRTSGQGR
jgi:hypothetical protein